MAMKLYSDVSVEAIADAIRNINGTETTYKIREMAPAINAAFDSAIDYVDTSTLNGNSNTGETISDGAALPIKKLTVYGAGSQTGTPTISNRVPVEGIFSVVVTVEDSNSNTRSKTLPFTGYGLYELRDGTKDELKIENKHLYIVKNTKKVPLTSSMGWSIYPSKNGAYCASFATTYGVEKLNYGMYATHFTPSTTTWDANYKIGWGSASPNTTLWVTFNSGTSEFSTTQQFKNWLDENDCFIIAKATTPQTIDLGEIENIFTYDGSNTITITTTLNTTYVLIYRSA